MMMCQILRRSSKMEISFRIKQWFHDIYDTLIFLYMELFKISFTLSTQVQLDAVNFTSQLPEINQSQHCTIFALTVQWTWVQQLSQNSAHHFEGWIFETFSMKIPNFLNFGVFSVQCSVFSIQYSVFIFTL